MKTIWKMQLALKDNQVIALPKGSTILTVQIQRGTPCLWALVDPTKLQEKRHIRIAGTGHPIIEKEASRYIGTVQMLESDLIWHVFEYEK